MTRAEQNLAYNVNRGSYCFLGDTSQAKQNVPDRFFLQVGKRNNGYQNHHLVS